MGEYLETIVKFFQFGMRDFGKLNVLSKRLMRMNEFKTKDEKNFGIDFSRGGRRVVEHIYLTLSTFVEQKKLQKNSTFFFLLTFG